MKPRILITKKKLLDKLVKLLDPAFLGFSFVCRGGAPQPKCTLALSWPDLAGEIYILNQHTSL